MDRAAEPMIDDEEDFFVDDPKRRVAPPCWCCKPFCICDTRSGHPLSVRTMDQLASCFMWCSGVYEGGDGKQHFNRSCWERIERLGSAKPIPRTRPKNGVYSYDVSVPNADGGAMAVRIYAHLDLPNASRIDAPRPVILNVHGGGFCIGHHSAAAHDDLAQNLCHGADAVVVSPDYRLAPEHPFPTGVRDCYALLEWLLSDAGRAALPVDCDPRGRLVLSGDSAGGNFALVLGTLLRDGVDADLRPLESGRALYGVRPWHMTLMYPALFHVPGAAPGAASGETKFFISAPIRNFFNRAYVPGGHEAQRKALADRRLSPMMAGVQGLPPTTLVTATDDALTPGCELLEQQMRAEGVAVTRVHRPGVHGFVTFPWLKSTKEARNEICRAIKERAKE